MRTHCLTAIAALGCIRAALAQTEIDPAHQYSWGESIGWMNWRDAGDPSGLQGVRVHPAFLSGVIWGENAGWIDVGSGAPANGAGYGNLDASDYGVNIDPTGDLFGLAWGESIGWLQFDTRLLGDQRARLDRAARRFRGYVWSENGGWINLDDDAAFVALAAPPEPVFRRGDANGSGVIDLSDAINTMGCLFLGLTCTRCVDAADSNDDGSYDLSDAIHTLSWLFRGGAAPPAPGPFTCGPDPTADTLGDCMDPGCAAG
jgi:hypothetical protein